MDYDVLPRGRHRLTRAQVHESQRGRMLLGIAEAVAAKGYPRATVADVLRHARVSRETFYQHFQDKEGCFLAVIEQCAELLAGIVDGELAGLREATPLARFDRAVRVYLDTLAAEPTLTNVFFLDSFAAGPRARQARFAAQERFVAAVARNFADDPAWRALPDPEFACRALVGAISSLVASSVARGDTADLPSLAEPVLALLRAAEGAT